MIATGDVTISDCLFAENEGFWCRCFPRGSIQGGGGAVEVRGSLAVIDRCDFWTTRRTEAAPCGSMDRRSPP